MVLPPLASESVGRGGGGGQNWQQINTLNKNKPIFCSLKILNYQTNKMKFNKILSKLIISVIGGHFDYTALALEDLSTPLCSTSCKFNIYWRSVYRERQ